MRIPADLHRRIALLRFLMIFGVVLLHTPPYVPIRHIGDAPFDLLVASFQHAIFRTTVPLLTFISAYLLFNAALDQNPVQLLRKKFRSLVIPFCVFNLLVLAAVIVLRQGFGSQVATGASFDSTQGWLDAAFGLTAAPVNYPLNFLRDLMVLTLLSPLLGWFLRRAPLTGLGLVLYVFYYELDGYLLFRDVMGPVFYLGGMAAVLKWDMRALDRHAPVLLAVFLGICACIIYFRIANTNILRLVAPALLWPAASLLAPTAFGGWLAHMSKYSFFLFLAHAPVMAATAAFYRKYEDVIPFPVYWMLAPVLVTGVVVALYKLAMRCMPEAFAVMIGMHTRPPQQSVDGTGGAALQPAQAGRAFPKADLAGAHRPA